jgi:hypothetical protein
MAIMILLLFIFFIPIFINAWIHVAIWVFWVNYLSPSPGLTNYQELRKNNAKIMKLEKKMLKATKYMLLYLIFFATSMFLIKQTVGFPYPAR